MKILFSALALCLLLAPARAQDDPFFSAPAPLKPPTIAMRGGIVITPMLLPTDDLREMLDVQMWSFAFQAPESGSMPTARLELRVPGQKPKPLGLTDSGVLTPKSSEFLIGIAPTSGTSLSGADKWKFYLRTKTAADDRFAPSINLEEANPLKDLKFEISRYSAGTGYALPKANGDIPLITLFKTAENFDRPPTLVGELVLVLAAKTPQSDEQNGN